MHFGLLEAATEYDPAGQGMQEEAPTMEYCPAGQATQLLAEEAPVVVEYVPAEQSVQTTEF